MVTEEGRAWKSAETFWGRNRHDGSRKLRGHFNRLVDNGRLKCAIDFALVNISLLPLPPFFFSEFPLDTRKEDFVSPRIFRDHIVRGTYWYVKKGERRERKSGQWRGGNKKYIAFFCWLPLFEINFNKRGKELVDSISLLYPTLFNKSVNDGVTSRSSYEHQRRSFCSSYVTFDDRCCFNNANYKTSPYSNKSYIYKKKKKRNYYKE